MGYLGLRGTEFLMKMPKGLLSDGFTSFSPPWQGMSVCGTRQVMVDQESEEWLQLEMGLYVAFEASLYSDLLPSVRPCLPKVPQPL